MTLAFLSNPRPRPCLIDEYAEQPKRLRDSIRRWLPYGMWTCADGRQVLFNRGYRAIWERLPGRAAEKAFPMNG